MKDEKDRIAFLEEQLRLSTGREQSLLEQLEQLSGQLDRLSEQLNRLTDQLEENKTTIESLEKALLEKNKDIASISGKARGLAKLLHKESEKITPEVDPAKDAKKEKAPTPKERGNNGAKRKEYFDMEEEVVDLWPGDPAFDKEKAVALRVEESIRYTYHPCRFVKMIYRHHNFVMEQKVYLASPPPHTPFLNSNYDASFIAGILQYRYGYLMPVERIVHLFEENGFDVNKSTAHGFISKTYTLLEGLDEVLRKAIHSDSYICMDETYHQIINEKKNKKGKATCKGYIWSACANHLKLVHFFYKEGSREKEVFREYLDKSYQGAVHTDGLVCYKEIETDTYPNALRISCAQHAKRKFKDVGEDCQAKEIIDTINELYRIEHKMLPEWDDEKRLAYRNEEAQPVLEILEKKLHLIKADPDFLPSTPLGEATEYLLTELVALKNYLLHADYRLDTNAIERANRSISLSRRNSLFFGSHEGAKRSALLFSLSCSCRLHHINTFEYFNDILNRMAKIPPNAPYDVLRELLPDRWQKWPTEVAIESSA
jgi:chaperonin cofactor prefoldin